MFVNVFFKRIGYILVDVVQRQRILLDLD